MAMAAIGGAIAVASGFAGRRFLGLLGLFEQEATGAAILGSRLMAAPTASISLLAAGGSTAESTA